MEIGLARKLPHLRFFFYGVYDFVYPQQTKRTYYLSVGNADNDLISVEPLFLKHEGSNSVWG